MRDGLTKAVISQATTTSEIEVLPTRRRDDDTKDKDEKKQHENDGFPQQSEITITVMMIPALMQTLFRLKGETLDRGWVERRIWPEPGDKGRRSV